MDRRTVLAVVNWCFDCQMMWRVPTLNFVKNLFLPWFKRTQTESHRIAELLAGLHKL
jgi:hypothetical protein